MVFEQFLSSAKVKKHPFFAFFLGFVYVFIGYFVATFFFNQAISVAMLFTTTLLLVPSVFVIINIEEKREGRDGPKHFLHDHEDIFRIFLFMFLGVFCAYLFLSYSPRFPDSVSYQTDFLKARGDLTPELLAGNVPTQSPGVIDFLGLVSENLMVAVICFFLSVFYGAGAVFLIVLNGSVFATYIVTLAQSFSKPWITGIFLIHLVPEISGFLCASIAGGVVSRAIVKERYGTKGFQNVMKDGIILMLIALGFIVLGAFLELFVTRRLI